MSNNEANLEVDRAKLGIERDRLILEQSKARWTAASIIGPFLVAAVTLIFTTYSQLRQADILFQTKTIELILGPNDANAVARARVIAALFPERLGDTFNDAVSRATPPDVARRELLRLASSRATSAAEVVRLWNELYPGDKYAETLSQPASGSGALHSLGSASPEPRRPLP